MVFPMYFYLKSFKKLFILLDLNSSVYLKLYWPIVGMEFKVNGY